MLVLTRHVDEEIVIGDSIRLKVLSINGNQVRLGIDAPASVTIFRREVHEAVCRQNEAAAAIPPDSLQQLLESYSG